MRLLGVLAVLGLLVVVPRLTQAQPLIMPAQSSTSTPTAAGSACAGADAWWTGVYHSMLLVSASGSLLSAKANELIYRLDDPILAGALATYDRELGQAIAGVQRHFPGAAGNYAQAVVAYLAAWRTVVEESQATVDPNIDPMVRAVSAQSLATDLEHAKWLAMAQVQPAEQAFVATCHPVLMQGPRPMTPTSTEPTLVGVDSAWT